MPNAGKTSAARKTKFSAALSRPLSDVGEPGLHRSSRRKHERLGSQAAPRVKSWHRKFQAVDFSHGETLLSGLGKSVAAEPQQSPAGEAREGGLALERRLVGLVVGLERLGRSAPAGTSFELAEIRGTPRRGIEQLLDRGVGEPVAFEDVGRRKVGCDV